MLSGKTNLGLLGAGLRDNKSSDISDHRQPLTIDSGELKRKLTVVLYCYEAKETYSRIGLLRSYGNLQPYWTTTNLMEVTVVLYCCEAIV